MAATVQLVSDALQKMKAKFDCLAAQEGVPIVCYSQQKAPVAEVTESKVAQSMHQTPQKESTSFAKPMSPHPYEMAERTKSKALVNPVHDDALRRKLLVDEAMRRYGYNVLPAPVEDRPVLDNSPIQYVHDTMTAATPHMADTLLCVEGDGEKIATKPEVALTNPATATSIPSQKVYVPASVVQQSNNELPVVSSDGPVKNYNIAELLAKQNVHLDNASRIAFHASASDAYKKIVGSKTAVSRLAMQYPNIITRGKSIDSVFQGTDKTTLLVRVPRKSLAAIRGKNVAQKTKRPISVPKKGSNIISWLDASRGAHKLIKHNHMGCAPRCASAPSLRKRV